MMAGPLALMIGGALAWADPPPDRVLRCSWRDYRRHYIQGDGRVIDPRGGHISTSEGQAYGMVRAVWVNDEKHFERMRIWTRDNLQSGDIHALPAWKWGQREDGGWGILDANPASDADQWMAYALLLAANQWNEPAYRHQAQGLLEEIWEIETLELGSERWMLPGPWAATDLEKGGPLRLNPSYFLPFAWRAFAQADPEHDWAGMIPNHYTLLERQMGTDRLPPDWLFLNPETGEEVPPPPFMPEARLFGFEAWRLAWTLAAEVAWYDESRARALLVPMANLGTQWKRDGVIYSQLEPDGRAASDADYLGLYGALLPAWALSRPEDVNALYEQHIEPERQRHGWGERDDYYSQNWVWFGLSLWSEYAQPVGANP